MKAFSAMLGDMAEFSQVCDCVNLGKTPVSVTGTTGSQKSHFIYGLAEALDKKCLVIASDEMEALKIFDDLSYFYPDNVLLFKTKEYVFYDVDSSSRRGETDRIRTLANMKNARAVVTSIQALMQYTLPKKLFEEYTFSVAVGDTLERDEFTEKLNFAGYKRVPTVEGVGQYAVRGSIVDVFTPTESSPVRIELFGDEVDSVRLFDVITQVSTDKKDSVLVCPVRELLYTADEAENVVELIRKQKNENLGTDIEKFSNQHYFASQDKYMPFFYKEFPSLMDYIDDDCLVFTDEVNEANERAKAYADENESTICDLLDKGVFPKFKGNFLMSYSDIIRHAVKHPLVSMSMLSYSTPEFRPKELITITAKTLQSYGGQLSFLHDDIEFWRKNGYRMIMVTSTLSKAEAFSREFTDRGYVHRISETADKLPDKGEILITIGSISKGFEYPTTSTVVISDGEIVRAVRKRKNRPSNSRKAIKSFDELSAGDYVVHQTHGIGQYVGIEQLTVDKVIKDYIKIKYKNSDILYVPTGQLESIHKYIGSEAKSVKLNSLGGTDWQRTTGRVKQSVEELAEDLIRLYAERSSIQGHIYPPDTPWQREFEDGFPYEETADQTKSIAEVKADMEQGKSMDRLLCGDVGYGKTEVAMRAAFKCVMDSMQVAYLVPTTILAQQHYNNFCMRMKDFPIKIEMMSRFRTKKELADIAKRVSEGQVDIVIGTHRILQKDVNFKNLGLLIIDEEQRFGVGDKERLKEMKTNVDVLTLSATPIPRTLHMAMVGIRDLSVLTEPPQDRYPVQTFVLERNDAILQNAVERELARRGQVYYLYNRVEGIERKAAELKEKFPDANIAVAHGKMNETQLEKIMMSLMEGEIDILVCTTIIETGLDVSNVNTIIIENADRLGLSQLYQLRGRVGRSNRLAYAYLTYERSKILDPVAQKRLQAIREFTEFGSGFKIAMRDLEIRGAGNLLGKQQHGNMNLVGYDMYCMLLEQAVNNIKGIESNPKTEVLVEIQTDAYIPKEYIEYEWQRVEMYKKISAIESEEDYYDVTDEFIDRYGDIPQPVLNLLEVGYIKFLARRCGVDEIVQKGEYVDFISRGGVSADKAVNLINEYRGKVRLGTGEISSMRYRYEQPLLDNIKIILQKLSE
ncbi:MAG: transcription-repair coupling factor [Clostridia bacterium]|nr:transcription-repair coupling factor [Clostridia bacterium]